MSEENTGWWVIMRDNRYAAVRAFEQLTKNR